MKPVGLQINGFHDPAPPPPSFEHVYMTKRGVFDASENLTICPKIVDRGGSWGGRRGGSWTQNLNTNHCRVAPLTFEIQY